MDHRGTNGSSNATGRLKSSASATQPTVHEVHAILNPVAITSVPLVLLLKSGVLRLLVV
jgi:hypothetical protein